MGVFSPKAIITYHVHYQMTTNETPVSWLLEARILQGQKRIHLKFLKAIQVQTTVFHGVLFAYLLFVFFLCSLHRKAKLYNTFFII